MRVRLLATVLLLIACAVEDGTGGPAQPVFDDDDADPVGEAEGWPLGYWFSAEYVGGDGLDKPPEGISFDEDGTWTHTIDGDIDASGTWELDGDTLLVDGETISRLPNCMAIRLPDIGGTGRISDYVRDDEPSDCPDAIPELTAAERCLVGEFVDEWEQTLAITRFIDTYDEHRLYVQEQIYSGHVSGDSHFTIARYWYLDGDNLCLEGIDASPECTLANWGDFDAQRQGTPDPACEPPVDPSTFYCMDSPGVISGGIGCYRENRDGAIKWRLSCNEDSMSCECTRDGEVLWDGRPGNSYACYDSAEADLAWAECCGL
jgi:hypothetical protein